MKARNGGAVRPQNGEGFKSLVALATGNKSSGKKGEEEDGRRSTDERPMKAARTDNTKHFQIHEAAMQHSIASSETEAEDDGMDEGHSWWKGVQALIDADDEDKQWWHEVEESIAADAMEEECRHRELEVSSFKRRGSLDQPSDKRRKGPQ